MNVNTSAHLYILLSHDDLSSVGEVYEEGEGQGVHVVDYNLSLGLFRQIIFKKKSWKDTNPKCKYWKPEL